MSFPTYVTVPFDRTIILSCEISSSSLFSAFPVLSKKVRRPCVQVPAVVIELRLRRAVLHPNRRHLFHMKQPDHHVCHLHASIVDIVLNLHAVSRMPQDTHHRVSQHGVPHMPDVRGLVRIDARMLDNDFVGQAFLPVLLLLCSPALGLSAL